MARACCRGGVFEALSCKALCRWCPDRGNVLGPVSHMTAGQLRIAFGVSPLLVSSYACDAACLGEEERAAYLEKSDSEFWEVAQKRTLQRVANPGDHDRWPPRLRDFFSSE